MAFNSSIYLSKPFRHFFYHLIHVVDVGAEYNILTAPVFDMLIKYHVKAVRLSQGSPQFVKIFLCCVADYFIFGFFNPTLLFFEVFLI